MIFWARVWVILCFLGIQACSAQNVESTREGQELDPDGGRSKRGSGAKVDGLSLVPDGGKSKTIYSYVDDRGRIRMVSSPELVPEAYREQVVATDTARARSKRLADDRVVVLDLRRSRDGQPLNYSLVDLSSLSEPVGNSLGTDDPGALGRETVGRAAKGVRLLLGVERAGQGRAVILYSAPWCGFCKKAETYLKQKGVPLQVRDIEASRSAAVELQRKMRAAGLSGGGIPVLDIGGTLVVGFNKVRIDELLAGN